MATDTSMDVSFLEKFGDGFNAFSEGVASFLTRLFGSSNERYVRKLGYITSKDPNIAPTVVPGSLLAQVNDLEERMLALSPEELKAVTPRLREQLAAGATLEGLCASGTLARWAAAGCARAAQKAVTASTTAALVSAGRSVPAISSSSSRLMIEPASSRTAGMLVRISTTR